MAGWCVIPVHSNLTVDVESEWKMCVTATQCNYVCVCVCVY